MFTIEKAEVFGFLVIDGFRNDGSFRQIRCAGTIDECLAWIKKEMDPTRHSNAIGEMHARNAALYNAPAVAEAG